MITATVKWRGHTMILSWEDGDLSGDYAAVQLAENADWILHQPPCGPLTEDPRKNPYAVALVFEATFDEVLALTGAPELPPGDLIEQVA